MVEGLGLGLLVDADHDRVHGRIQVDPDNVADLGLQLRVGAELERLDLPRLQASPPAYRLRQDLTVGRLTPTKAAISTLLRPCAASSTIRARCASPAEIDDARVHSRSTLSSPTRKPHGSTRDRHHELKSPPESH